jgi:hypothetical protein
MTHHPPHTLKQHASLPAHQHSNLPAIPPQAASRGGSAGSTPEGKPGHGSRRRHSTAEDDISTSISRVKQLK